jgi:hypothetical protein
MLNSFPVFHGTRRFNTEFTRALHLFLSLARPIQSTSPHLTSPRSILILSTHLRLSLPSELKSYLKEKCRGSGPEIREYGRRDPQRWPRNTPLFVKFGANIADKSFGRYSSLED